MPAKRLWPTMALPALVVCDFFEPGDACHGSGDVCFLFVLGLLVDDLGS